MGTKLESGIYTPLRVSSKTKILGKANSVLRFLDLECCFSSRFHLAIGSFFFSNSCSVLILFFGSGFLWLGDVFEMQHFAIKADFVD